MVSKNFKVYVQKSTAKTFIFTNRQKSSSEIETRNIGPGGQDFEDDSKYPLSITYCQTWHGIGCYRVGATFKFIVYRIYVFLNVIYMQRNQHRRKSRRMWNKLGHKY